MTLSTCSKTEMKCSLCERGHYCEENKGRIDYYFGSYSTYKDTIKNTPLEFLFNHITPSPLLVSADASSDLLSFL